MINHTANLHTLEPEEINVLAVRLLTNLSNYASLNLISKLTRITRPTLYRWTDEAISYDEMNPRDAAWFILMYETSPQIQLLLDRQPSRPRLAYRLLKEGNENAANA